MKSQNKFLEQVIPFVILGISIAFMIALLVFFSYILIWGLLIGGILAAVAWVKQTFFSSKNKKSDTKGRIIEHDDRS